MRKLCNFECLRQEECLKAINNYQQITEDTIKQSVRCFVDRLQETVDLLLTQFDQVTVFEKVAATGESSLFCFPPPLPSYYSLPSILGKCTPVFLYFF